MSVYTPAAAHKVSTAYVPLLDDFAPAYQKPVVHPLCQAVSDAEERKWNAIRTGDQAAIDAAALHLHHCQQKASEKTRADMRKQYDQLTLDERHQQWLDSQSDTRPATL